MKPNSLGRVLVRRIFPAALAAVFVAVPLLVAADVEVPTVQVPVNETIRGASEDIAFSGQVTITAKLIDGPDFMCGRVLQLMIDFSQVKGRGLISGRRYVTSAQTVVQRSLMTSEPVLSSFPYYPVNNPMAARTVIASFAVRFSPPAGLAVTSRLIAPSA